MTDVYDDVTHDVCVTGNVCCCQNDDWTELDLQPSSVGMSDDPDLVLFVDFVDSHTPLLSIAGCRGSHPGGLSASGCEHGCGAGVWGLSVLYHFQRPPLSSKENILR